MKSDKYYIFDIRITRSPQNFTKIYKNHFNNNINYQREQGHNSRTKNYLFGFL